MREILGMSLVGVVSLQLCLLCFVSVVVTGTGAAATVEKDSVQVKSSSSSPSLSSGVVELPTKSDSISVTTTDRKAEVTYVKQDDEPVRESLHGSQESLSRASASSSSSSSSSLEISEKENQTVSSDEAGDDEARQDVRIKELLKGIMADEFGSEEEEEDLADFDSDEPDVFHEDAGEVSDDSENEGVEEVEESVTTTIAPDGTVTTEILLDEDNEEDSSSSDVAKTTVEAEESPSERSSRAEETTLGKSGRKVNRRRNKGGKKSNNKKNKNGKKESVVKYNRYVDAVFKRMNGLIRSKRMDPLRVNLYAGSNSNPKRSGSQGNRPGGGGKKRPGNNNNNNNKVKKNGAKGNQRRTNNQWKKNGGGGKRPRVNHDDDDEHLDDSEEVERQERMAGPTTSTTTTTTASMDNKMRPSSMEALLTNKTVSTTVAPSNETSTTDSESKEMKPGNSSGNRPTRGVLHGLSTLRRNGPVKVIHRGPNVRVLRSNFMLGPVALEILQKSANSSKAETTATATARSLRGVLEIRLKNAGPTRIRRLRVYPPSNVRVKGEKKGMKRQGYRKISPVAAKRLISVANQVVRQSDQNRGTKPGNKKNKKRGRPGQKRPQQQAPKRNGGNRGKNNNNKNGGRRRNPKDHEDDSQ